MKTWLSLLRRGALAVVVALAGTAAALAQVNAGISIEPDTLDFLQVKGGKFAIASFVIRNTMDSGRISGNIGSLGGVFKIENGSTSFDLGPGEIHVVSLRFTPSAPRLWTDSIAITHNVSGTTSPMYIYLRGLGRDTAEVGGGAGDSLNLIVSPRNVNFGGVRIAHSSQRTVTITNGSDSTMLVGSISTDLMTGPFSISSGGGVFSLGAGESRSVVVNFAPTAPGVATGQLMVAYSGSDSAGVEIVNLSGFGIVSGGGISDSLRVSIQPSRLNFGNVRLGQTSQRSFTIRNNSDTTGFMGTLMPLAGTTPYSIVGGITPINLSAGQSQTVTVQFAPTTRGSFTTDVVVSYMANGSLQLDTIQVMGFGVDTAGMRGRGRIAIQPERIDFGRGRLGQTFQRSVTVMNVDTVGTLSGTIMNPVAPFYLTSGAGSFTLAPNESRTITLSYTPVLAGTFTDNLAVNYMGPEGIETAYISLSGVAEALSSVEDREEIAAREGYALDQNRPNPFGMLTSIGFTLPKSGHAVLRVFNTRGEMVATLVDGDLPAGEHTVNWSAEGMESGMYLYQLQSGSISVARRLSLVK